MSYSFLLTIKLKVQNQTLNLMHIQCVEEAAHILQLLHIILYPTTTLRFISLRKKNIIKNHKMF